MSAKKTDKPTLVYIPAAVKRDFQRRLLDVVDAVAIEGKPPDQSNVTAALWRWFAAFTPAEAQAFLRGDAGDAKAGRNVTEEPVAKRKAR